MSDCLMGRSAVTLLVLGVDASVLEWYNFIYCSSKNTIRRCKRNPNFMSSKLSTYSRFSTPLLVRIFWNAETKVEFMGDSGSSFLFLTCGWTGWGRRTNGWDKASWRGRWWLFGSREELPAGLKSDCCVRLLDGAGRLPEGTESVKGDLTRGRDS